MNTNKKWLLIAISGSGIVLISCCLGAAIIGAITLFGDPHPTKLVGVWKGPFDLRAGPEEVIYTFNQDGSFRQQSFKQGQQHFESHRQWGFRSIWTNSHK